MAAKKGEKKDWIKVKDARPDYNVPVLVVICEGDNISSEKAERYKTDESGDYYRYTLTGVDVHGEITHWQPLPKLPRTRKTKKEGGGPDENNTE